MTPQEKARELYSKYYNMIEHMLSEEYSLYESDVVKQIACKAVDEMLNELDHIPFHDDDYAEWKMKYWKQVKTEIENL